MKNEPLVPRGLVTDIPREVNQDRNFKLEAKEAVEPLEASAQAGHPMTLIGSAGLSTAWHNVASARS